MTRHIMLIVGYFVGPKKYGALEGTIIIVHAKSRFFAIVSLFHTDHHKHHQSSTKPITCYNKLVNCQNAAYRVVMIISTTLKIQDSVCCLSKKTQQTQKKKCGCAYVEKIKTNN